MQSLNFRATSAAKTSFEKHFGYLSSPTYTAATHSAIHPNQLVQFGTAKPQLCSGKSIRDSDSKRLYEDAGGALNLQDWIFTEQIYKWTCMMTGQESERPTKSQGQQLFTSRVQRLRWKL